MDVVLIPAMRPFIVFVWKVLTQPASMGLAQVWLHSSTFDLHTNQQAFHFPITLLLDGLLYTYIVISLRYWGGLKEA